MKSGVLGDLPGGGGKADQLATIDRWGARLSFRDTRKRIHREGRVSALGWVWGNGTLTSNVARGLMVAHGRRANIAVWGLLL